MSNPNTSLAVQEPSVSSMLGEFIQRGITAENVSAFAQLVTLKKDIDKMDAEKAFTSAFVTLQQALPVIVAKTEIKNRGKYEKFEDVMNAVQPILTANGFAVSFTNENTDGRITETCHLMHSGGHSRSNSFTVRVSKNADHETQADCKAATTAKRNALLNALNIVIRQDCLQDEDDVKNEGGDECVTAKEAANLRDWVEATDSDVVEFLAYAKASSFETIRAVMLPKLEQGLRIKEKQIAEGKK